MSAIFTPPPPAPIVYLSGPMSGLEDFNYPAFLAMAEKVRRVGFLVINPAEIGAQLVRIKRPKPVKWEEYMRQTIAEMMRADWILMLDGWDRSRGARIERQLALELDINIAYSIKEIKHG